MVTAVWGWTFVLVKDAITQYPVLPFLELRFLLAALVMAIVVHRLPSRRELWVGVVAGTVLAGGYLFTFGAAYAFLTITAFCVLGAASPLLPWRPRARRGASVAHVIEPPPSI